MCVHAHVYRNRGSTLGISALYLIFFRLHLLLKLKIGCLASKSQESSCLYSSGQGFQVDAAMPVFYMGARNQIKVLMLSQQALYQLSLPQPLG